MAIILVAAVGLFHVPVVGSLALFWALTMLFIVANLSVGYTFSTVASNQLQAMQMSFFFFLPSMLLSGFLFPFRGMPDWAQAIGEILPLTHFIRISRAIMLKGSGASDLVFDTSALAIFTLAARASRLRDSARPWTEPASAPAHIGRRGSLVVGDHVVDAGHVRHMLQSARLRCATQRSAACEHAGCLARRRGSDTPHRSPAPACSTRNATGLAS